MNLTTSFFNKTLFKCNLKRMWWVCAISALIMFLTGTLPLYDRAEWYKTSSVIADTDNSWFFTNNLYIMSVVMSVITAFALAVFLFSYLNKVNACSCIHGLPVTRTQLYFTHLITAFVLMFIPFLLNAILWISPVITLDLDLLFIVKSFYLYLVYGMIVMAVVTVMGMLTGNSIAQVVFSGIAVLLPLYFTGFFLVVCEMSLYGYSGSSEQAFEALMKYVYLAPELILSVHSLIYVVLAVVLFALGYLLYKMRALETCTELISFPKMKNVFKLLVALCSGMLGFFYMAGLWQVETLLSMIPFSVIGLVIAHMLANKSFSLKGIFKVLIVTVAMDLAIFAFVAFDISGFERRVPEADDVLYVEFNDNYVRETFHGQDGEKYTIAELYVPKFKNSKEIQAFIDLHKHKVDNRQSQTDALYDDFYYVYGYRYRNFDFVYTLKNGSKMYRSYLLTDEEVDKYLSVIYETDTQRAYSYPILDNTAKIYENITVYDVRSVAVFPSYQANTDEFDKLLEALKADRENISFEEMNDRRNSKTLISIEVSYKKQGIDKNNNLADEYWYTSDSYNISENDVNTIKALKEIGYFENSTAHTTADGLNKVAVSIYDVYSDGQYTVYGGIPEELVKQYYEQASAKSGGNVTVESAEVISKDYDTKTDIVVGEKVYQDKEKMTQLFDLAFSKGNSYSSPKDNGNFVYLCMSFYYDDGSFNYDLWKRLEDLPEFIIQDFSDKSTSIS